MVFAPFFASIARLGLALCAVLSFALPVLASCPYCNYGAMTVGVQRMDTLGRVQLNSSKNVSAPISAMWELTRPGRARDESRTLPTYYQEVVVIALTKVVDAKTCLPTVTAEWGEGNDFGTVGNFGVTYGGRLRVSAGSLRLRLEKDCGYPMEFLVKGVNGRSVTHNALDQ